MKLRLEQVNAMTRSELCEAMEDEGADPRDVRKLTQKKLVVAYWEVLGNHGNQDLGGAKAPAPKAAKAKKATTAPTPSPAPTPPLPPAVKADKGKDCACGCGERTKGGTWMPGHDAKFHSAQNGGAKKQARECKCGCGEMTKGGFYRPGHDAKHMSVLLKQERAGTVVGHMRNIAGLEKTA